MQKGNEDRVIWRKWKRVGRRKVRMQTGREQEKREGRGPTEMRLRTKVNIARQTTDGDETEVVV